MLLQFSKHCSSVEEKTHETKSKFNTHRQLCRQANKKKTIYCVVEAEGNKKRKIYMLNEIQFSDANKKDFVRKRHRNTVGPVTSAQQRNMLIILKQIKRCKE